MRSSSNRAGFMFNLPAVILFFVFFFLPVVITFIISATDMSSSTGFHNWKWVWLDNYVKILKSPRAMSRLWLTIKYVGVTLVFFNVGMGLVIAILTTQISRRAGSFFRALWLLPRVTPTVVYVMMWIFLSADAPYGVFNQLFLQPLGIEPEYWIATLPFLSIVLVNGYIGASFGMIIFTSAIESIPKDYLRAAMVDGAGFWQRVRYIILPALRWPLLFVTTYQTLSLLTSFEQILILTDGAYNTEVWALWSYHRALNNYWGNFQWGFGSALAGVLVLIGIIFAIIYMRFFKFETLVHKPKIEVF
jgi:inositol-phosphate transport system permease protein